MKRFALVAFLILPFGCKKEEKVAAADPKFDQDWSNLANNGAEPAYIEGDKHGAGLMGEVRRAVDPLGEKSPLAKEVNGPLPDSEVAKVIRANLPAVKGCYAVEEKNGTAASGKAIMSLQIDPSGAVKGVDVVAPAFNGSGLPSCLSNNAKAWKFPKFTQGPKSYSYPFVFVGG
jgi:hypothetical protein